jgi:predicted amidophosphoribosyltransferase
MSPLLAAAAEAVWHWIAPPTCAACGLRVAAASAFCVACAVTIDRAPPGAVHATFAFGGAIADAIRAMKYGARPDLARPLAALVEVPTLRIADVRVVPVPSHPRRVRARGFDPVATMARHLARRLGVPFDLASLRRTRDTPPLAGLGAVDRRRAVDGAFALARPRARAAILLFDDVTTTGATLAAAARPFLAAGVDVTSVALARAGPSTS